MIVIVDIGINLAHDSGYQRDRAEVIARARQAGVAAMIVTGSTLDDSARAIALCRTVPGMLRATAGVHPHHALEVTAEGVAELRALLAHPEVLAVGECGLDYFRDLAPRPAQRRAFEQQLGWAGTLWMPSS